jgi:single-strand DNA-binding protein
MPNVNIVLIAGHLTRKPALSYLPSKMELVEFGIAVSKKYKDKERTCFVDCKAFGKLAVTIDKYLDKGNPAMVEGELDLEQWEKDGKKRSKHSVLVNKIHFLGQPKAKPESEQPKEDVPEFDPNKPDDCPF